MVPPRGSELSRSRRRSRQCVGGICGCCRECCCVRWWGWFWPRPVAGQRPLAAVHQPVVEREQPVVVVVVVAVVVAVAPWARAASAVVGR